MKRMIRSFGRAAALALLLPVSARGQNPAVTVAVDAAAARRAINPLVYGTAHASTADLNDLNVPLNRSGGNNTTRYNWAQNADNRAQDWYYESIAYSSATPGEMGDTFISQSRAANAQPMLTIPIIDWVAKLGASRGKLASFSVAKYGAQTDTDWQWMPDAGNGILKSNGQYITTNDPNDANVRSYAVLPQGAPAGSVAQKDWVSHLVGAWGTAQNGGLKYYILDNEHSIWFSTHRDVHNQGASMDEIRQKMLDYGAAIKDVDPSALVVGPEEWGWTGYLYSGKDQKWGADNGWSGPFPDRSTHNNMDYLPWLLDQLHQSEVSTGRRLLDVFTVHYYPQGGEFSNDTSTTMQQRRARSTRSLWDPNYTDETWINDKVKLIPRIKGWVAQYYPGLQTGLTEYNWGAEAHMSGATAQADVWGIFGREGLDMGARWTTPAAGSPAYLAMKMYRNYDGAKSAFGETSVSATGPNPDNVAVFASQRTADGALTVMVISKYPSTSTATTPVTVNLANFSAAGTANVWQLADVSGTVAIRRPSSNPTPSTISFSGSSFSTTVPGQSVTLFVIPSGTPNAPPVARASANPTSGIVPLAVAFDGSASSDSDGSIASYAWAFGDGTTGSGATTSHTYSTTGTFNATLTVTDNRGATSSASVPITVSPNPNVIAAPSGLSASIPRKTKNVALAWTDNSSNETNFLVERAVTGSTSYQQIAQVGANVRTYTDTPGVGRWTYRVRAYSSVSGAYSAYSNTASVRIR